MTTALTPVKEIQQSLARMQDSFKASLPEHIPAERFIAVAQTALVNNPSIANLERNSVYQAFMQAALDGLMPDGRECAIIPYGGKAKYTPMVGGVCKKVRNSGEIGTVDAQVVYDKDVFESWVDEKGPHFKHVRAHGNRGLITLTYAYALGKDGSVYFEEVSEEQMQKIRAMSKAKDSPWNGPFADEMRRKSALRRLAKYRLPNSSDMSLQDVLKRDDEPTDDPDDAKTTTDAPQSTPTRLGAIVGAQTEPTIQEAVAMVKEVIPEAKVVSPAPKKETNLTVTGKIQDLQAKDGEGAKGPWRRFAAKIDGSWYGTFDKKINEQLTSALDGKQEVTIEYAEVSKNGRKIANIVKVTVSGAPEGEAFDVADDSIPI